MTGVTEIFLRCLLLSSLAYQMAEAYTVELNVVVDELAIDKWKESSGKSTDQELRAEIDSVFVEVSKLYASLEYWHVPVKFVIKNLTLHAENVVSAPYGEIGTVGLEQFRNWMFNKKKYEEGDWDVAIYLTGLDVVGDTKSLLGFGQIDRVCTDWGVGLLEFMSQDYGDAFVLAHEIGHILGANHDGFRDLSDAFCDPNEGYIMTSTTPVRAIHHFKFSYCSYIYFYNAMSEGHWDCLKDAHDNMTVTGRRLGELEGADETCRRELDKDAFLHRPSYFKYGDRACTYLVCDNGAGEIKEVFAPQGMYCGKNKQCVQGKCIVTKEGRPNVPDDCPFGDSPKIDYKTYKTCDDLPLHYCGAMKDQCCKRCSQVVGLREADKACKTLDSDPESMLMRGKYGFYGDKVCRNLACTTGYDENRARRINYYKAPNGMACGTGKRCLDLRCLPSEDNPPTIPDICPFGDQAWNDWTCLSVIREQPSYCSDPGYRRRCCGMCLL